MSIASYGSETAKPCHPHINDRLEGTGIKKGRAINYFRCHDCRKQYWLYQNDGR
jgi:hypothetical protein